MNTHNKHFSYTNTDTLGWGNPSRLDNSRERRAIPSSSSPTSPSSAQPVPLTCSRPRALPSTRAESALFSLAHPTPAGAVPPVLPGTWVPSRPLRAPGSGLSASPPATCPPTRLPAPAPRPRPPGGRLRPHPAPGPPLTRTQPVGAGDGGERPDGGTDGAAAQAYLSMASSFSSSSFCRSITAIMMFLSSSVRWLRSGSSGIGGGTVGGRGPRGPTAEDIFAACPPLGWPGLGAGAPSDARPAAAPLLGSPRSPPGGGGGAGERASPGCHGPPPPPSPGCCLCFGGPGEARAPGRFPQPSLPGGGGGGGAGSGARGARMLGLGRLRPRCGRRVWVSVRRSLAARLQ